MKIAKPWLAAAEALFNSDTSIIGMHDKRVMNDSQFDALNAGKYSHLWNGEKLLITDNRSVTKESQIMFLLLMAAIEGEL